MLDSTLLRSELKETAAKLLVKGYELDIALFNEMENKRKSLQIEMETLQSKRNNLSKQIGILKAQKQDTTQIMNEVAAFATQLQETQVAFNEVSEKFNHWLATIPNVPNSSVPHGKNENDNVEVRRVGTPKEFDFIVKDHVDLGVALNKSIDFEAGAKVAGSRFAFLKDQIAKLHRVLAQFMLNTHTEEHGYTEVYSPYMANAKALFGTGQLPKFEEDMFKTKGADDDLYLISTSEISVTNMFADEILKEAELPQKFTCHSPCFRSEAGSYGRDTKGLIRMHQFDKVEMVNIAHPDNSYQALEDMVQCAEVILQKLGLPYRVVALCGGDMGFGAAKTYDLEVWIPSQNTYREISSCSNMTDFQARRMQTRFKDKDGKNQLVHTLNGSGLAVGRTLVAILENYQNADGNITVPEILRPMMGCDVITKK